MIWPCQSAWCSKPSSSTFKTRTIGNRLTVFLIKRHNAYSGEAPDMHSMRYPTWNRLSRRIMTYITNAWGLLQQVLIERLLKNSSTEIIATRSKNIACSRLSSKNRNLMTRAKSKSLPTSTWALEYSLSLAKKINFRYF